MIQSLSGGTGAIEAKGVVEFHEALLGHYGVEKGPPGQQENLSISQDRCHCTLSHIIGFQDGN